MGEGKYRIETSQDLTSVTFLSEPSLADLREALRDVHAQPSGRLRLWDYSGTRVSMNGEEARALAAFARTLDRPPTRVAILVATDVEYGIARMHLAWRDEQGMESRVFRDRAEALAWLATPDPQAP